MQPLSETFLALLLAHLLGDFPLQPSSVSRDKGRRAWPLIWHGITHYFLACASLFVFAQLPLQSFFAQSIILTSVLIHLAIDKLKHVLIRRRILLDSSKTFLLDQVFHVIVLTFAALILTGSSLAEFLRAFQISPSGKSRILATAIVYVAVIFGGGYLIRYLTRNWARDAGTETPAQLRNAGLYVGWIERFLVITAIAMQSPALVGLILTGKSIARFPEFKEARFAEYFLIGTLLSVSLSVIGGIILLEVFYGTATLK